MLKLLLFVPAMLLLIPITNAFAQVDPVQVLVENSITSNDVDYPLSSTYNIEISSITGVIRIHGFTTTGEFYLLYLKEHDSEFSYAILYKDDHFHKAELKELSPVEQGSEVMSTKPTTNKTTPPQNSKDFKIVLSQPFRTFWTSEFKLDIRAYESDINILNDISFKEGYVKGLDVSVVIYDVNGDVFKEFSGITDEKGYFQKKFVITERLTIPGEYTTVVKMSNGIQNKTHTESFSVVGEVPSGNSHSP